MRFRQSISAVQETAQVAAKRLEGAEEVVQAAEQVNMTHNIVVSCSRVSGTPTIVAPRGDIERLSPGVDHRVK